MENKKSRAGDAVSSGRSGLALIISQIRPAQKTQSPCPLSNQMVTLVTKLKFILDRQWLINLNQQQVTPDEQTTTCVQMDSAGT